MAGKLSKRPPATEQRHQSSDWTFLVDRGVLYHIDNSVYNLFVAIELTVDEQLSVIFQSKGRGIKKVKKENLKWLCEDEEIQHSWSLCTGVNEIEDQSIQQALLQEIAYLWVTIRGHSKAKFMKEQYKQKKKECVKLKHSLQHELANVPSEFEDS